MTQKNPHHTHTHTCQGNVHTRKMKFISNLCFNKSSIYSQSLGVIFMVGNLQSMCEHMVKKGGFRKKKAFILIDHSSQFSRFICIYFVYKRYVKLA